MASLDITNLGLLGPEERIKRIQELETERRNDIELLRKLMAEALKELDLKLQKQAIPIDQVKSDGLSNLVSEEEKEIFRIKRFQKRTAPAAAGDLGTAEKTQEELKPLQSEQDIELEKTVEEAPASSSGRQFARSKEYQSGIEQQLPSYNAARAGAPSLPQPSGRDHAYALAGDMIVRTIIELAELHYKQTSDPQSFGKQDIAKFYKLREDVEKIREFRSSDEELQLQMGISEKLINRIRYSL
ncbi:hypothetical protein HYU19_04200 [Candidatus Woesearchaeota archaeon]|nr:hypothetical protein [Candidatus Woesearchaeota archaeon]